MFASLTNQVNELAYTVNVCQAPHWKETLFGRQQWQWLPETTHSPGYKCFFYCYFPEETVSPPPSLLSAVTSALLMLFNPHLFLLTSIHPFP